MVSIFDKTNNKRSIFHAYNSRIDSKNDAKKYKAKLFEYYRTQAFSCETYKIFKNISFYRRPLLAGSAFD